MPEEVLIFRIKMGFNNKLMAKLILKKVIIIILEHIWF